MNNKTKYPKLEEKRYPRKVNSQSLNNVSKERLEEIQLLGRFKPKLSYNKVTRDKIITGLTESIVNRATRLIDIQTVLAFGSVQVFRSDKYIDDNGNYKWMRPYVVTNPDELSNSLDHHFNNAETPDTKTKYYFVMIKEPDAKAIDSLLDRGLGKTFSETMKTLPIVSAELSKLSKNAWNIYTGDETIETIEEKERIKNEKKK